MPAMIPRESKMGNLPSNQLFRHNILSPGKIPPGMLINKKVEEQRQSDPNQDPDQRFTKRNSSFRLVEKPLGQFSGARAHILKKPDKTINSLQMGKAQQTSHII
jgi:hypothetical protein